MSFENLPENWTDLPITAPGLAVDVVDLLLKQSDRERDALLVVPCDEDAVPVPRMAIVITEMDWRCTAADRQWLFAEIARLGAPGVALAVSAGGGVPSEVAERWRRSATRNLQEHGVELLTVCSADMSAVREVTRRASDAA